MMDRTGQPQLFEPKNPLKYYGKGALSVITYHFTVPERQFFTLGKVEPFPRS